SVIYSGKAAHASTPEKGENAITAFLADYSGSSRLLRSFQQYFQHGDTSGKGIFGENSRDFTCVLSLLKTVENSLTGGIDIRFPMNRTKAEVSGIICNLLEKNGFTIDSCEGSEPHYTNENSYFVKSLLRVYERVTGDKGYCITIGGGTYVHEIEGGVAFGAEFPDEDGHMHGADEYITIDNLLKNAEIIAEAIIEICS
ncbi:MAG: M20/M25/M40 family metallo-hydrolase, partial [Ruminococcus sp.]|nr:M20/M25/M40 family metallo-hydrolase [Ruminococcus sp.]